jgi:hypothetical protein
MREVSGVMDLSTTAAALSTTTASSGVLGSIDLSMLASVQNLQAVLVSELFGSIGIGASIDAYA